MGVNRAGFARDAVTPHTVEQQVARHHDAAILHKVAQHLEFLMRELYFRAGRGYLVAGNIQADGARFEHVLVARRARFALAGLNIALVTAQQRVHARNELHHAEGLRQIVVGTRIEPADRIEFGRLRGEHHDGHIGSARIGAQALEHRNTVFVGQHYVEKEQIGHLARERNVHFRRARKAARGVARLLERIKRQISNLFVIFEVIDHPRTSPL